MAVHGKPLANTGMQQGAIIIALRGIPYVKTSAYIYYLKQRLKYETFSPHLFS